MLRLVSAASKSSRLPLRHPVFLHERLKNKDKERKKERKKKKKCSSIPRYVTPPFGFALPSSSILGFVGW
jgi:hypothetical protein